MEGLGVFHGRLSNADVHPRVAAYYFKQWEGFEMAYHSHREVEIMYVISGKCVVETLEQVIMMDKGSFILIDAYVEHRLIVEADKPCRMLNVEFNFAQRSIAAFPSLGELASTDHALNALFEMKHSYLLLNDPSEVYHTLKSLVLELDNSTGGDGLMVQLQLSQLLIRIGRLAEEVIHSVPYSADQYVKQSVEYIHHHYDCDIQVKEIAAAVSLHPGYLHRIFKAGMGCTMMDYLMRLRMEKARMLLEQTDIPVIDICSYVGVNSRQYFSTLFKRYTGVTPKAYRQSVMKEVDRSKPRLS